MKSKQKKNPQKKLLSVYIILMIAVLVMPPLCIHLIFDGFGHCRGGASLTAADVLGYTGTVIAILGSVVVASITFFHEREKRKLEKEDEEFRHKQDIHPALTVRFRQVENKLLIIVTNLKDKPALFIHIEDQFLFSAVQMEAPQQREVEFSATDNENALYLYSLEDRKKDGSYPQTLTLYYMDIDRNTIEQEFVHSESGNYTAKGESFYL